MGDVTVSQVSEVLDRIDDLSGPLLVAASHFSFGKALVPRVGVIATAGEPHWLWEGFMALEGARRLRDVLRQRGVEASFGGWDAMFATGWDFAWTVDEPLFRLFRRGVGVLLEASAGGVTLAGDVLGAIAAVETYAAAGWVERGVRLELADGSTRVIASTKDLMAALDPTYDWLDLDCDASWARALGRVLASTLGVSHRVTWDD